MQVISQRQPWYYSQGYNNNGFNTTIAGYEKRWNQNLVQLTVKGAGHMVPMDRPQVALQMILNFLSNAQNYSIIPAVKFPCADKTGVLGRPHP